MAKHPMAGLIKWSEREGWAEMFDAVFEEHFGETLEGWELEFEELDELIGEEATEALWACAFEDFVTRPSPETALSVVDDYLKRRGWKETPSSRRAMEALRDSLACLYEVAEAVPRKSVLLRDMLRDGKEHRIADAFASEALVAGDFVAARVLDVGGTPRLGRGWLDFDAEFGRQMAETCREAMVEHRADARRTIKETRPELPEIVDDTLDDIFLIRSAPQWSGLWLDAALGEVFGGALEDVRNTDGDEVALHMLRFPLAQRSAKTRLRARLSEPPSLRQSGNDRWDWFEPPVPIPEEEETEPVYRQTLDDGMNLLGTILLETDALVLRTDSAARAERAAAIIREACGDLLGAPETQVQSIAQAIESDPELAALFADEKPE